MENIFSKIKKIILMTTYYIMLCYIIFIFFDECIYYKTFHIFKNLRFIKIEELFRSNSYIEGKDYNKKPIYLFGCSFTYGVSLEPKQKFAYKLSKLTKCPVYNFALPGYGVQPVLYFFEHNLDKYIFPEISEPQYIIYTYIDDHIRRLYNGYEHTAISYYYPIKYFLYHGNLIQIPVLFPRITGSYMLAKIKESIYYHNYDKRNFQKDLKLLKAYFIQIRKISEKKYPNSKFVIVLYDFFQNNNKSLDNDFWKELEKEGFIIIKTLDMKNGFLLKSDDYKLYNDNHPNEKAWDIITPQIVEQLNL